MAEPTKEPVFDLEATILDLITIVAALKLPPTGVYPEAAAAMERLRELAKHLGMPVPPPRENESSSRFT